MSNEDDKLLDHEYDGIQELNNPLPGWWLATFYGTIIFAVAYYIYYTFMGGPDSDARLAEKLAAIDAVKQEAVAAAPADEDIDVKALIKKKKKMEVGKKHFVAVCAACHGQNAEGIIGPNLTDKYWIHSKGDAQGIINAIRLGFPEKGMPPWDAVVPRADQPALAAYVISLQGSNPANAKEPQGDLVE